MTLYLIRHGETDWNRTHLLQGTHDIPLNENGLAVARKTARGMEEAGLTFDRIYSSPLSRAYETARILCPDQPIETDPRLREISFGNLEGTVCADISAIPMPAPGGESGEALQARMLACLRDIAGDPANQGKTILVSTHGAAIRSVMMALKGIPQEEFWQGGVSKNCGVTILQVEDGEFTIDRENIIFYTI